MVGVIYVYVDTVFGFHVFKLLCWMFQHDCLDTCCFECLIMLYACVLYFCICPYSAQCSVFHMERRSRSTLIVPFTNVCGLILYTGAGIAQLVVCWARCPA